MMEVAKTTKTKTKAKTKRGRVPAPWPPTHPRITTAEQLDAAATSLTVGDHRAGLLRAIGNSWAAFFGVMSAEKIREMAEGIHNAATSKQSSSRTKLRAAEVLLKLFIQGTKLLLDAGILTDPSNAPPASDSTVTIDLDDPNAVQQLRAHLEVMERIAGIKPVEVATVVAEDADVDVDAGVGVGMDAQG